MSSTFPLHQFQKNRSEDILGSEIPGNGDFALVEQAVVKEGESEPVETTNVVNINLLPIGIRIIFTHRLRARLGT